MVRSSSGSRAFPRGRCGARRARVRVWRGGQPRSHCAQQAPCESVVLSGLRHWWPREHCGKGVPGLNYRFLANGSGAVVASLGPVEGCSDRGVQGGVLLGPIAPPDAPLARCACAIAHTGHSSSVRMGQFRGPGERPSRELTTFQRLRTDPERRSRNPRPFNTCVTTFRFLPLAEKYFSGIRANAGVLQTLPCPPDDGLLQNVSACQHERPLRRPPCNVHARSRRHLLRKILTLARNGIRPDCDCGLPRRVLRTCD